MAEEDLLPFYQQFFTENLFLIPETSPEPAPLVKTVPVQPEVLTPEDAAMGDTTSLKRFTISGENKKGLVLLFSLPGEAFAVLPKNDFLTKILAAINHTPSDVAYINLEKQYAVNIFDLSKETKVQQVVAFGSSLIDLATGFQVNLYKPAGIGQIPLLLAEPLHLIENDVNRKKQLWSGLKAIFLP